MLHFKADTKTKKWSFLKGITSRKEFTFTNLIVVQLLDVIKDMKVYYTEEDDVISIPLINNNGDNQASFYVNFLGDNMIYTSCYQGDNITVSLSVKNLSKHIKDSKKRSWVLIDSEISKDDYNRCLKLNSELIESLFNLPFLYLNGIENNMGNLTDYSVNKEKLVLYNQNGFLNKRKLSSKIDNFCKKMVSNGYEGDEAFNILLSSDIHTRLLNAVSQEVSDQVENGRETKKHSGLLKEDIKELTIHIEERGFTINYNLMIDNKDKQLFSNYLLELK